MNEELYHPLADTDPIISIVYIVKDSKYNQLLVTTPERVALSPETYDTVWGPFYIAIERKKETKDYAS